MALIDRYIDDPHFCEKHSRQVSGSHAALLAAAEHYRTESDRFFRTMIAIREFPMRVMRFATRAPGIAPAQFGVDNFTLMERGSDEIVYGLAGRFWQSDFGLIPVKDANCFRALNEPVSAKLALNFTVHSDSNGASILSTETRVICTDSSARARFAPYWYLIRPVSGLIRRRVLSSIERASHT